MIPASAPRENNKCSFPAAREVYVSPSTVYANLVYLKPFISLDFINAFHIRPLLYGLPPSWRPLFVLRKGVVRRNRQFFILGRQGRGKPTCQN